MPEIRWEANHDELAVLDGYCSANGIDRSKVIRTLLKEWSDKKKHEATVICRVAGINPTAPEGERK
jgi:ribosomal protein L37E